MNKLIKIGFSDFWPDFNKEDNLFSNLLRPFFELEISEDPDILFYSCYGTMFLKHKCHRIFFTAENVRPNFRECDFSLSFDLSDYHGHNLRLPLYIFTYLEYLKHPKDPEKILSQKKKFCNMVVSNPNVTERNSFFLLLNNLLRVDSGGRHFNNIGFRVKDKLSFMKDYKFTIAFENSSYPGYVTEKIIQPMLVDSIPIYWGNPMIYQDFNTKSFINANEFNSLKELAEYVVEVENNDTLYKRILSEPYLLSESPLCQDYTKLSIRLKEIIEDILQKPPVALNMWKRILTELVVIKKKINSKLFRVPYQYA
ncbi:MAG: glycosyltransferase family 10 [Candidatus Omnitrophica bacterium]|nr:glycosyltransferase family 10 [Candidatus Omnitrophota bacterium]